MPLIVKEGFLENNSWLMGDLNAARSMIDAIIGDLEANGRTHTSYVLEKLEKAESILANVNSLCRRSSKVVGGGDDSGE